MRSRKRVPSSTEMNAISTDSATVSSGFALERNGHIKNGDAGDDETSMSNQYCCPHCNYNIPLDRVQTHAENCLRRSKRLQQVNRKEDVQQPKTEVNQRLNHSRNSINNNASSTNEDVGVIERYEEYEWAGQKRIRLCSLLSGGYAALGIGQNISNRSGGGSGSTQNHGNNEDDEDEDLNVDEDDTQIYGPAQYDENDVIPPNQRRRCNSILNVDNDDDNNDGDNEENENGFNDDVTSYMRRLITGADGVTSFKLSRDQSPSTSEATTIDVTTSSASVNDPVASTSCTAMMSTSDENYKLVIESLKAKLYSYESQTSGKYKCLICLDDYKNPAISVACWHVHCEQCWLRSLGARKLCPQCNLITTPKDLRRIYM